MKISRKEFKAWLEGKDPRVSVGVPLSKPRCPIGRFLDGRDWPIPWPKWTHRFVIGVDKSRLKYITAGRALRILKETRS